MTLAEAKEYVITFGKHKGRSLDEVPWSYLHWLARGEHGQSELVEPAGLIAATSKSTKDTSKPTPDPSPRKPHTIGERFAEIDGVVFSLAELRSMSEVRTPVDKGSYKLTHVLQFHSGALGTSKNTLWATADEAKMLGEHLLRGKW